MSTLSERRFMEELAAMIQKNVIVTTNLGKTYTGVLSGVEVNTMSVCLTEAKDQDGKNIFRIIIYGRVISEIREIEKPFDLKGLAERLERVFPKMVKVMEDAGVIIVMDKIRVTANGVIEGVGPAAERAKKVYEEFIKEAGGKP
ncbi:Lsm family RNA-binding protein [Candidatus Bathyarchaeota archaeon]|nr:Lsm family RNA-binding protein [Candidatus Bathyarchaeota archaeon]